MAKEAECFWLMDIVVSYQPKLKNVPFQIWGIKKEGDAALVTCKEDSDKEPIVTQKIPYTDFPLEEYEFYCIEGIVLLKGEY